MFRIRVGAVVATTAPPTTYVLWAKYHGSGRVSSAIPERLGGLLLRLERPVPSDLRDHLVRRLERILTARYGREG